MDRYQRFRQIYDYLYGNGYIHAQKDLAEAMGASASNVSTALATGNPKVLTDKFFIRLAEAYRPLFSLEWMLTGNGTMLTSEQENTTSPKTDEQSPIVELYSGLIKELEYLRMQTTQELAEVQAVKHDLQLARDDFKKAAVLLNTLIKQINVTTIPYAAVAADPPTKSPQKEIT